jgi:hypothetical protein
MRSATQFAVIVAAVGTIVLASAKTTPNVFDSEVIADRGARAGTPEICFAGRPCPGRQASICFAGDTARNNTASQPSDARSVPKTARCPKANATYRIADTPVEERR